MVAGRAGRGVIAAQPGPAIACFSTSMLAPGLLDDDIACSMCSNAFCLSAVGRATALVDDIARSISASASSFAALDITYRYGSLVCVVNKRLTTVIRISFSLLFLLDRAFSSIHGAAPMLSDTGSSGRRRVSVPTLEDGIASIGSLPATAIASAGPSPRSVRLNIQTSLACASDCYLGDCDAELVVWARVVAWVD